MYSWRSSAGNSGAISGLVLLGVLVCGLAVVPTLAAAHKKHEEVRAKAQEEPAVSPGSTEKSAMGARPPDEAARRASVPESESTVPEGDATLPGHGTSGPHDRHRNLTGIPKLIAWLGNFHPPLVHFPIAMLVGAALAEILLMVTGREIFQQAARYCVWIGALSAVPTAVLGWFFGGFQLTDDERILTAHRWLGTVTASWAIALLAIRERRGARGAYRLIVFIGAALAMVTGFFGGALVYGLDHYAW